MENSSGELRAVSKATRLHVDFQKLSEKENVERSRNKAKSQRIEGPKQEVKQAKRKI